MNQYDTPKHFGIPNPLGPRTHNWRGGAWNEGSLFHGPIYTRPAYGLPRIQQPLFGVGATDSPGSMEWLKLAGGAVVMLGVLWALDPLFDARHR